MLHIVYVSVLPPEWGAVLCAPLAEQFMIFIVKRWKAPQYSGPLVTVTLAWRRRYDTPVAGRPGARYCICTRFSLLMMKKGLKKPSSVFFADAIMS
jgi:hypothetical protein